MPYDKNNRWIRPAPKPSERRFTNHVRPGTSSLLKDDAMGMWLGQQKWSEFAQSLYSFYCKNGGFTEKQLLAAEKMRIKVDENYDPYGNGVDEGVYIDDEDRYIFKIASIERAEGDKTRSVRKRLIDVAGWSDIKLASNKALLFESIKTGKFRILGDDELIAIGKRTGICCDCGRILDNPQSIAAGIGPHCAKKRKGSTSDE